MGKVADVLELDSGLEAHRFVELIGDVAFDVAAGEKVGVGLGAGLDQRCVRVGDGFIETKVALDHYQREAAVEADCPFGRER